MISISLHEANPDDMDLKYKEDREGDYEDAFQSFVFQEPSIVLSEDIKNELNFDWIYSHKDLVEIGGEYLHTTDKGLLILDDIIVDIIK